MVITDLKSRVCYIMDPEQKVLLAIEATRAALGAVGVATTRLVDHEHLQSLDDFDSALSPLESAQFDVSVAYSIASLYYVLLRTKVRVILFYTFITNKLPLQGVPQQAHPVKAELDRIKDYVRRLKQASDSVKVKAAEDERPANDASAAKRMIEHELGLAKRKIDIAPEAEPAAQGKQKRRKTIK